MPYLCSCQNLGLIFQDLSLSHDTIVKIEFYYLPWGYKAPRRLNDKMVRDYHGENSTYTITDRKKIEKIANSLIIFNMNPFKEMNSIDVRMVIDFYFKKGEFETMLLNYKGHIMYNDSYYHTNYYLAVIINKYIPKASIPGFDD